VTIRVFASGRSDVGLHREHNEDSFALLEQHGLFVVADGMGGHRAGDVASHMATETLRAFFDSTAREDATWPFHYDPSLSAEENRLLAGIKVANKSIYERSATSDDHRGMGTTVVGVLVSPASSKAYIGHVGDSRCYRVRGRSIALLTQDHSLVNEYMRAMPHLSDAQRDELPRNVITRALGMNERVLVDLACEDAVAGDRYVLCSDGLSGMITDDEILGTMLAHADPDEACGALIALANQHGGEDNITAVVVKLVDAQGAAERAAPEAPAPKPASSTRETVPPTASDS
jgi:serine/threonine protein phosphatase PrpC